jgi:hypothetical protein
MAQRKPVMIDGEYRVIPSDASLAEIASPQAQSVLTSDGQVVHRGDFARWAVPDGFETVLSPMVKG